MSYVPAWQRLADAVETVMACAGRSREAAQTDICLAIADRTVKIRGKPGRHTIRSFRWNDVLEGKDFKIPPNIKPADFDWENSRPVSPWPVRREVTGIPGLWNVEWIEVFRADVTDVLCTAAPGEPAVPASSNPSKTRSRPALERAQRAFHEAFPNGDPGPAALPNKTLSRRVDDKLKELGLPGVSKETALRAAGRRRK